MKKNKRTLLILAVLAILLIGIGGAVIYFGNSAPSGNELRVSLYFLNAAANKLEPEKQTVPQGTNTEIVGTVFQLLYEGPKNKGLTKAVREDIVPLKVKIAEKAMDNNCILEVEFSDSYRQMAPVDELFFRAALVWTMTDLSFIDGVHIYVEGEELLSSAGQPLGPLNRDNVFIDPQIQPDKSETQVVTLYFTDGQGQSLVSEKRSVVVNPDQLLEKYILEQLIAGPQENGLIQLIPPETKIRGEIKKEENICYVNFSGEFVSRHAGGAMLETLTVYSIVNSLTELSDVKKVQILVEGEKLESYKGNVALNNPLERNKSLNRE